MFILERLHIKYKANSTQYKSYVNKEIGTRRLVHNKRMFILSDPDCISVKEVRKVVAFCSTMLSYCLGCSLDIIQCL